MPYRSIINYEQAKRIGDRMRIVAIATKVNGRECLIDYITTEQTIYCKIQCKTSEQALQNAEKLKY